MRLSFKRLLGAQLVIAEALVLLLANPAAAQQKVRFNRDVRPILSDTCFQCHGPDKNYRKAKLRLDDRAVAIDKGAIVPGKVEISELVARIFATDADKQMPPPSSHKKLTTEQKNLLKRWIAEGAEYQGHWAYEKPVRPAVPMGVNGVDYLVGKRLSRYGLKPSPRADGRTLARRLSFDLVGLPPRPDDVLALTKDNSTGAYDSFIARLLGSPHHGERMALGWLDVVRYADTIGYHSDTPRNVFPYRDYVIKAFTSNMPFDRFTIEQIAGDLLPESTQEQKVASAFNRLLLSTEEGGAQARDYEARMLTDRVRAVGTVWLGLTLGCCQCHDHKFDPATIQDFYSMGAFFADIQEPIIGKREDGMVLASAAQVKEDERLRDTMAKAQKLFEADKKDAKRKADFEKAKKEFTDLDSKLPHCLVSISSKTPRTVRLLPRGNWMDQSGQVMTAALPGFLSQGALSRDSKATRLDLARWIVSRDNPLTARVFVNRLWKQFFGIGLSKVLDDLGSQGEWPANPELLDWLACEFMDSGWDVRHMIRVIVGSQTYQQVSTAPKGMLARDPDNRLLSRQSRFRLDAELIRDQALFVSGLLNPKIGGPSVKPYQPAGYWENLNFPVRKYVPDKGPDQYRRGLYTWWQRSFLHPSLLAFDAPTREECAAERSRSNIPQQALVLLNDPTFVEAARVFALRIMKEGSTDAETRLAWAWQHVLQRDPRSQEKETLLQLLAKQRQEYVDNPKAAQELLGVGFAPVPGVLPNAELAAWTSVARVLLNLHETITRN